MSFRNQDNEEMPDTRKARVKKWFRKKVKEMSQEYKFNFFLRLALEIYLEVTILSMLNLKYPKFTNFWQIFSFLISGIFLTVLTVFFVWTLQFSCKNFLIYQHRRRIDIPEVQSMFGQYKTDNLPQAMFNTYFMTRRLLYACIIIFLPDYPIAQAFFFMIVFIPIFSYHVVMNPYIDVIDNVMMDINETSFMIIGVFFFMFAEPITDDNKSMALGWTVVGLIIEVIMLNIIVLWILKFIAIKAQIKEYLRVHYGKSTKINRKEAIIHRSRQLRESARAPPIGKYISS